jgi:hypothetical protein
VPSLRETSIPSNHAAGPGANAGPPPFGVVRLQNRGHMG